MPEVVQINDVVRVRATPQFIEYLNDSKIFSHPKRTVVRWTAGDWLSFKRKCEIEPYSAIFRGEFLINMGLFSYMTMPVSGMFQSHFCLGRWCSIGGGLRIPGNNHPMHALTSSPIIYDKNTGWVQSYIEDEKINNFPFIERPRGKGIPMVGNDVWIGGDVTLNHGVKLGHGSVIAAHAVVTRDVPDYAVGGGNPAKIIRYRFDKEIITELLELQPWQYSIKDLSNFNIGDMPSFVRQLRDSASTLQPWNPPKAAPWAAYKEIHGLSRV